MNKKRVCIIGAGPAGLVSLRNISSSEFLTGTLFEKSEDVGGLWNYKHDSKPHPCEDGALNPEEVPSMYDNLVANTPFSCLQFHDCPHLNPPRSFLKQHEVHSYLRYYCDYFDLWPHIKLCTKVIAVKPETPVCPDTYGNYGRWLVTTENTITKSVNTEVFDSVMVCIGKTEYPYGYSMESVPGLQYFEGQVLHSKYFRNPKDFKGKHVVLIGLGPTAGDLMVHLACHADSVTLSHSGSFPAKLGLLPKNCREATRMTRVTKTGIVTEDNEEIPCNVIIFCTGFDVKFPFLHASCQVSVVENKYVPHLYKSTVFTKQPSLAILGMGYRLPEFAVVEMQAMYFKAALEGQWGSGNFKLPDYVTMENSVKATEEINRERGWHVSLWHQFGSYSIDYCKYFGSMAEEIGVKETVCKRWPLMEALFAILYLERIFSKMVLYKSDSFRYIEEDTIWEYTCSGSEELGVKTQRITLTLDPKSGNVTKTVETVSEK